MGVSEGAAVEGCDVVAAMFADEPTGVACVSAEVTEGTSTKTGDAEELRAEGSNVSMGAEVRRNAFLIGKRDTLATMPQKRSTAKCTIV